MEAHRRSVVSTSDLATAPLNRSGPCIIHQMLKPFWCGLLALLVFSAGDKEKLRAALGDTAPVGVWFYDDLDAAYAEAGRTGKPLMVVLRCVP